MEDENCPDLVFDGSKPTLLCVHVYIYIRIINTHMCAFYVLIYMEDKYVEDDRLLLPTASCAT